MTGSSGTADAKSNQGTFDWAKTADSVGKIFGGAVLGAILTFSADMLKLRSAEKTALRANDEKYSPLNVKDDGDLRMRTAEYWSIMSNDGADRERWKNYLAQLRKLQAEKVAAAADKSAKEAVAAKATGPAEKAQAEAALVTATARLDQAEAQLEPYVPALTPRVYIHVSDKKLKPTGQRLQDAVQQVGGLAPGVQLVDPDQSPSQNQFRYFRSEEASTANAMRSTLATMGFPTELTFVPGYEAANIRANHFEIWMVKEPVGPSTTKNTSGQTAH